MENRTAIVFGATGLIGRSLLEELCISSSYEEEKNALAKKLEEL